MMRWVRGFLAGIVVLVLAGNALAIDPIELADPALQERYRDLTHELRCMQCQNAWLWVTPVILLLLGLAVAIRVIRQRARLAATDTSSPDDPVP